MAPWVNNRQYLVFSIHVIRSITINSKWQTELGGEASSPKHAKHTRKQIYMIENVLIALTRRCHRRAEPVIDKRPKQTDYLVRGCATDSSRYDSTTTVVLLYSVYVLVSKPSTAILQCNSWPCGGAGETKRSNRQRGRCAIISYHTCTSGDVLSYRVILVPLFPYIIIL